ncbi:DUF397 domain-containing protein [Streptomyces sp. SID4919]|uniref:DUF397 domain-containing protein n=1 Tax=unclassified Streptomyces TaxID=2593676 RepID=UPI000823C17E|nr:MULTISPECIES: DUF397 domain-containing protein [unclassified Streptomyces]MYY10912.1 DUF397 domain-containing protein [Streptomyces sp. SID4919]SCK56438.1 protein of unknown function [Streptomyces sp. AmelKG-E11A]
MIHKLTDRHDVELAWFKSSYSNSSEGDTCVEVADVPGAVLVRDSKNVSGPRLGFAPTTWADFVSYASES